MNFSLFRQSSALVFTIFLTVLGLPLIANAHQIPATASIQKKLAELEASVDGRLGVSAINTANNTRIQYRGEERFPFCSTSKVMTVAAILKESEKNQSFKKTIIYGKEDVEKSGYAPITQQHLSHGMSVNELCQAAIEYSDNTAMNLLMKLLGGPSAVNTYAESIGDHTFRLDRWEPELNTAIPGDNRDTTTPNAMADSLKQLALGNSLALPQRGLLQTWLKNNTTGNTKIRAGVPKNWVVGDKTGSGSYGTTNDIAVIWPSKCSPIVLMVYLTQKEKDAVKHDEVIASATHLVLDEFAKTDQCIKTDVINN